MTSAEIRKRLKMSRVDLARSLNITERTVYRWEEVDGGAPVGLAAEVMRGISEALEQGADAERLANRLRLGIGSLLYFGLTNQMAALPTDKKR